MSTFSFVAVGPNGTGPANIIDATSLNSNFSNICTAGNNINYQNIGSAGIYASQMIPTTNSQAQFGGGSTIMYTFPAGVSLAPNSAAFIIGSSNYPSIALRFPNQSTTFAGFSTIGAASNQTIKGISSQVMNITDSGTILFAFDRGGDIGVNGFTVANAVVATSLASYSTVPGAPNGSLVGQLSTSQGILALGGASANVVIDYNSTATSITTIGSSVNVSGRLAGTTTVVAGLGTSTGIVQFGNVAIDYNSTATSTFTLGSSANALGTLKAQPTINGASVLAPVAPVYTSAGVAQAGTVHRVIGAVTVAIATGIAFATANVALSGVAAFSTSLSYSLVAVFTVQGSTLPSGWTGYPGVYIDGQTSGGFQALVYNTGNTISTGTGAAVVTYMAEGT